MAKLKSTAVKVYPTAFRGPSSGSTKYNPESRLNTEFNVTNLTSRIVSKDNFVIDWNLTTKVIKFNIHGYYFESNLTEFLGVGGAGAAWTTLYASIKLLPFQTSESGNTAYKAFTLVGTEDSGSIVSPSGRILDVDSSGTFIFEGVDLHQTAINPAAGSDVYELHLLSGGPSAWAVPLTSRLKFVATDVEGLPKINNDLTLDTADTVFAPITAGDANKVLISAGGANAPVWSGATIGSTTQPIYLNGGVITAITGAIANNTTGSAATLTTPRLFTVTDNDATNSQAAATSFDGSSAYTVKLPATIKANVTGNVSGNAGTVTNGVYTTGDQTIGGNKTFSGTTAGITKTMVGLGNVDNTSDENKPVSTAQQTALNLKANLAGPTFTGTVGGITATMVGLGNVTNNAQVTSVGATSPIASSGGTTPTISVAANFTIPTSTEKTSYDGAVTHAATTTGAVHGATTVGNNLFRLSNPDAITFLRVNANNTVTTRSAADFKTDLSLNNVTNESKATMFTNAALTVTPTAPTAANTVNDTQIATTAFVRNKFTDFYRYNRIGSQTGFLTATSYTSVSNLGVTLKTYTNYRFKIYILYTRNGGNNSSVYLSPYGDYLGGPGPSGYFISQYNATNTATALTIQGLKSVNASAPSDASSLQLPSLSTSVSLSFAILEGTYYTANSTSMSVAYKMSTGGSGGISFWEGSYILFEEIVT